MISRRRFLISGGYASLGASFGYGRYVEPFAVEVTQVPFAFKNKKVVTPFSWVQLSDLHAFDELPFSTVTDAISLTLYQSPDFVCITGDFITSRIDDADRYGAALKRLTDRVPVYAVTGNHDGGHWAGQFGGLETSEPIRKMLSSAGVRVLHNTSELLSIRGSRVQLVGVGDIWAKESDPESAGKHLDESVPTILLSHNPDSKQYMDDISWDLMLSGHTHGGQLCIPFSNSTPLAPVHDHRYVAGLNSWKDRWIYTNRGIGSIRGMRINCRPEITVFSA